MQRWQLINTYKFRTKRKKRTRNKNKTKLGRKRARVGVTIPSFVRSTAAFEMLIIQKEQAAYKRKIKAINLARARQREAKSSSSQAEARAREAEARARQAEARAREAEARARGQRPEQHSKLYTKNHTHQIQKETPLFGDRLMELFKGSTIHVNLSEVEKVENM